MSKIWFVTLHGKPISRQGAFLKLSPTKAMQMGWDTLGKEIFYASKTRRDAIALFIYDHGFTFPEFKHDGFACLPYEIKITKLSKGEQK